jgi:hypothetical protein
VPREAGAAENEHSWPRVNGLRGCKARFKFPGVIEKVSARSEHISIDGAAHPLFLYNEIHIVGVPLLSLQKSLPCCFRVSGPRPYGLHLDVEVVAAAVDYEVDLATIRQKNPARR